VSKALSERKARQAFKEIKVPLARRVHRALPVTRGRSARRGRLDRKVLKV
jgi:hypothetical protein